MDEFEFYQQRPSFPSTTTSSTTTTAVHVTALDGIVNVNSLFTVAVFVGLSLTNQHNTLSTSSSACDVGVSAAKDLLVLEVVSFSFFLFSSLVAQGLKLAVNILNSNDADEAFRAHISTQALRAGMLGSAAGSVLGCLFLLLSMVYVVEIRLGRLGCSGGDHRKHEGYAVASLVVLVTSALLVYISTTVYAFLH